MTAPTAGSEQLPHPRAAEESDRSPAPEGPVAFPTPGAGPRVAATALTAERPAPNDGDHGPGQAHVPLAEQAPAEGETETVNTASATSPVGWPRVGVHAGINHGTLIGQLIEAAVMLHRGDPLSEEWVDAQIASYVTPASRARAESILLDARVLVLVADASGSGRWTTALHLLRNLRDHQLTIRQVRRDIGECFEMEGLREQRDTGWILDLRAPDDSLPSRAQFGHQLRDAQVLKDAHSYLIVVVGSDLWETAGKSAGHLAVTMEPLDAGRVLEAHLRSGGVCQNPGEWSADHRIKLQLQDARPGQVAEWARTIIQTEAEFEVPPGALPAAVLDAKISTVVKARSRWTEDLADWHSERGRTSFERNYLLATAVFDGAAVDGIHRKVASLATALGEKTEPVTGQQGPGLVELTRQIKAVLQADGSVRFPGPGFAGAVVEYFWLDRPHLLDEFTKWTVQQCLELEEPQRSLLAERVIPWVLHHSRTTRTTPLLRSVAARWSEDPHLVSHAVDLLVAACLDPQVGNLVKGAVTAWPGQSQTSVALKRAIATTWQTLAPTSPTTMLRRLAELTQVSEPAVGEAVGAAINTLWDDPALRPRLDEALTGWSASGNPALRHAANSAFLHLAAKLDSAGLPAVLPGPGENQRAAWVVSSWRSVLEARDVGALALGVGTAWLDASTTSEHAREVICQVLVRAVHETETDDLRGTRMFNLFRIAENWRILGRALDETARNELRGRLIDQANAAAQAGRA